MLDERTSQAGHHERWLAAIRVIGVPIAFNRRCHDA